LTIERLIQSIVVVMVSTLSEPAACAICKALGETFFGTGGTSKIHLIVISCPPSSCSLAEKRQRPHLPAVGPSRRTSLWRRSELSPAIHDTTQNYAIHASHHHRRSRISSWRRS